MEWRGPLAKLQTSAFKMIHIPAFEMVNFLERRPMPLALDRLILHHLLLQAKTQAPSHKEVLRQAPEEKLQHQALDHHDDAKGQVREESTKLVARSISTPAAPCCKTITHCKVTSFMEGPSQSPSLPPLLRHCVRRLLVVFLQFARSVLRACPAHHPLENTLLGPSGPASTLQVGGALSRCHPRQTGCLLCAGTK